MAPRLPATVEIFDDERASTPAVADLDGDGLREVAWVDPTLLRVFVWNVEGVAGDARADWPMYAGDASRRNASALLRERGFTHRLRP